MTYAPVKGQDATALVELLPDTVQAVAEYVMFGRGMYPADLAVAAHPRQVAVSQGLGKLKSCLRELGQGLSELQQGRFNSLNEYLPGDLRVR